MMSASSSSTKGQFTGWHMLILIVSFFTVIIAVNVFMAFSAIRTWTGLVVQNSYTSSQEFNTKLRNANAQAALGWQGGLAYDQGILRFTLIDGDGAPLHADVIIALSRPIGVLGDQSVHLTQIADGSYTVPVALESGKWNAVIVATFDDQPAYEHRARFQIEPGT